ncbi:uncharacterized protein ATNIH1004_005340 [Aspergillus tanneri]|uniref:Uncharacterized protein n=1 Tax=Aspergillus tanneri TaxID=1220188 RepID=A0A5M9MI45_9EURO|nr:uncharacterized protein ATNIH1004_005340 [Aspergillus tanneri]KAA8646665.1 hypothetical protein ATNIH1004_005340 [Aspergillus tanneri]
MARPGQEAGEDEPQNQRRISILPQGTDNPETITKNEFLTKALDDPNGLLEEILRMWNLEQEDKVNEIREVIRQKDAALADLIEGRDKYRDAYAHECLRGRETSVPLSTTETPEFLRLAGESQLHQEDHKEELFEKVTEELRNLTTRDFYTTTSFNEYSTARAQAYYTFRLTTRLDAKTGLQQSRKFSSTDATNPKPTVKDTTSASRVE